MTVIPRSPVRVVAFLVMVACPPATALNAAQQLPPVADQAALAEQLLSENAQERRRAFGRVSRIEPSATEPILRDALITLLHMLNGLVAQARLQGVAVEALENPEFVSAVARTVAELEDPRAISAMAGALDIGPPVFGALAEFGELALPDVLAIVRFSPDSFAVGNGLRAMQLMVENQGKKPISAGGMAQIRAVVAAKMRGKVGWSTLWLAIGLASVLNDPDVLPILAELAKDRSAIVARGITEPEFIDKTQQRAAGLLEQYGRRAGP